MTRQILQINKQGIRANFNWLPILEKIIIKKLKIKKEISIALVSKAQIKQLNKTYRHKNYPTDVLSFGQSDPKTLGEIIICPDIARRNAIEDGKSLQSELQLLTVHGILHLLGYDHEKSGAEKKRQEKMEQIILTELNK